VCQGTTLQLAEKVISEVIRKATPLKNALGAIREVRMKVFDQQI
jgi:hypothetical protein